MTDEQLAKAQEIKGKIAFWEKKLLEEKEEVRGAINLSERPPHDDDMEKAYRMVAMYGACARLTKVEEMISGIIADLKAKFEAI